MIDRARGQVLVVGTDDSDMLAEDKERSLDRLNELAPEKRLSSLSVLFFM